MSGSICTDFTRVHFTHCFGEIPSLTSSTRVGQKQVYVHACILWDFTRKTPVICADAPDVIQVSSSY